MGIVLAIGWLAWLALGGRNVMPPCVVPCRQCGAESSRHVCGRCGAVTP